MIVPWVQSLLLKSQVTGKQKGSQCVWHRWFCLLPRPDDMTHSLATDTGAIPHKLLLLFMIFFPGAYFELATFCYIVIRLDEGNFWPLKQNGHLFAFLMFPLIVMKDFGLLRQLFASLSWRFYMWISEFGWLLSFEWSLVLWKAGESKSLGSTNDSSLRVEDLSPSPHSHLSVTERALFAACQTWLSDFHWDRTRKAQLLRRKYSLHKVCANMAARCTQIPYLKLIAFLCTYKNIKNSFLHMLNKIIRNSHIEVETSSSQLFCNQNYTLVGQSLAQIS